MKASSGTTLECRKNTSSRDRRSRLRLASIDRRRIVSMSPDGGFPRLHLLVTRAPGGYLTLNHSPTTCSAFPSPPRGERPSRVIPAATAACTVATHSSNVVGPQSIPRPPPPRVRLETGGSWPNWCCCMGVAPCCLVRDRSEDARRHPGCQRRPDVAAMVQISQRDDLWRQYRLRGLSVRAHDQRIRDGPQPPSRSDAGHLAGSVLAVAAGADQHRVWAAVDAFQHLVVRPVKEFLHLTGHRRKVFRCGNGTRSAASSSGRSLAACGPDDHGVP